MSSAQDIAHALRDEILNGSISPGQELRQEELAKRFQVSRIPIRDALNLLARDRLISLRPNRGGKVISLGAFELEEIYDLRIALETDALERSFERFDKTALKKIVHQMRRCELEANTPDFPEADWRFHCALYAPSERPRQIAMIQELRNLCQMHRAAYTSLRGSEDRWSEDHRAIIDAVEQRDLQMAKSHLRAHLQEAGQHLRNALEARPSEMLDK